MHYADRQMFRKNPVRACAWSANHATGPNGLWRSEIEGTPTHSIVSWPFGGGPSDSEAVNAAAPSDPRDRPHSRNAMLICGTSANRIKAAQVTRKNGMATRNTFSGLTRATVAAT